MIRHLTNGRGALLTLVLTAPTLAQDPKPTPSPEAPRYEESVDVLGRATYPGTASTATKLSVPLENLPVSVNVISSQVMEAQDARVLGDALQNAPGVNVGTVNGVTDFFTIRGFDSLSSSLVLVDGASEPEASFYHLYNARRVEVLRGPGAYLYGGNPLSGAVNILRKQPLPSRFADLQFSGGSFSTFEGQLDANYGSPDGKGAYRINALAQSSDQYRDAKKSKVFAINPSATWKLGESSPLSLSVEYVDNDFKPDAGLPILGNDIPNVPRTRSYQSPFDHSDQKLLRGRADFQTRLGSNGTLRNKLYYTDLEWKTDGTLLLGAFPAFPGEFAVARTMTFLDDRQKLLGNQLEASWNLKTGSVKHTLLVGFEASQLKDDYTLAVGLLPVIFLNNPVETATQPVPLIPGQGLAGDTKATVIAPYLVDQIAFTDKVQLLVAGRYDSYDYEDTITRSDRSESELSPLLGLSIAASPKLSLYGNFGKAFAPPSSLTVGPREPEKTTQYEGGLKSSLRGGKLTGTLAYFDIEKENIAIPDQTGVTKQQGTIHSKGIEVDLHAQLSDGWFASANYAFTDAKLEEFRELQIVSQSPFIARLNDYSGNRVPFAPRNVFNFWTQREWKSGFGAAAGARYVCTQFIAEDNAFKIKEHWTFDAALSYKVKRATLRLNLKNLSDQEYTTRGFGNASVIPANPFAVYGSIQIGVGSHQ